MSHPVKARLIAGYQSLLRRPDSPELAAEALMSGGYGSNVGPIVHDSGWP